MAIKSDIYAGNDYAQSITGSGAFLGENTSVGVGATVADVQDKCTSIYDRAISLMSEYKSTLDQDAEHIKSMGEEYENFDKYMGICSSELMG